MPKHINKFLTHSIISFAPDAITVCDDDGVILFANPLTTNILGVSLSKIIGKYIWDFIPPEDISNIKDILREVNSSSKTRGPIKHQFLHKDNYCVTLQTFISRIKLEKEKNCYILYSISNAYLNQPGEKSISPLKDENGNISHHIETGIDIMQSKLDEEKTVETTEKFALSLKVVNDGLWDWDFKTGKLYLSSRWKSMLGYTEDEVKDTVEDWFNLIHPDDIAELKNRIKSLDEGEATNFEYENRINHKKGNYLWVLTRGLAARDANGKVYRMAGSQTDISERKAIEFQLQHDALYDALTGLPNRILFMDRLDHAIKRAKRYEDYRFIVLFMNLDRFKIINDSLGHLAGDQLLIEVAQRVKGCLRDSDTLSRFGGDEFAMLIDDVKTKQDASFYVNRIQSQLTESFKLEGRNIFTSGSIGIALFNEKYESPDNMIRDADTAMYHAKSLGRSRYAIFDGTMHYMAIAMLEMETDLRLAIENHNLHVYFQPIISLNTGQIAGFESLIRWLHPQRGFISPAEFIPIAEEIGLIYNIGLFVLHEACRFLRTLQSQFYSRPPLSMSVNLSAVQFRRPELINQIDLMVREYGLEPWSLKLEITESTIIEHAEYAKEMMTQLKAQSIHLSLDDFGTGYSSITNLHRYPIDTVKIDQSFVMKMCVDNESLEIVRSSINMAHNLKMDVVAEGVETAEQLRILRGMKCQFGQGYYFSRAIPQGEIKDLLLSGKRW